MHYDFDKKTKRNASALFRSFKKVSEHLTQTHEDSCSDLSMANVRRFKYGGVRLRYARFVWGVSGEDFAISDGACALSWERPETWEGSIPKSISIQSIIGGADLEQLPSHVFTQTQTDSPRETSFFLDKGWGFEGTYVALFQKHFGKGVGWTAYSCLKKPSSPALFLADSPCPAWGVLMPYRRG